MPILIGGFGGSLQDDGTSLSIGFNVQSYGFYHFGYTNFGGADGWFTGDKILQTQAAPTTAKWTLGGMWRDKSGQYHAAQAEIAVTKSPYTFAAHIVDPLTKAVLADFTPESVTGSVAISGAVAPAASG